MKRTLSADQQAKRDARRAQFKLLVKALANIPDLQRVQIANKYGVRTVEGRELSLCNTMLCYMQNPTASMVGGFRQWIKQGRAVKKGEHGIMIWCPTGCKKDGESTPTPDAPATEADETRFIIGTVFDIGQTQEIETPASQETNEAIVEHCGEMATV